jgi:predicted Fe-Mo cluster-binding NifX family protein
MKIAIPAFHSKVSPRFDTAQELVLLEVIDGKVINRERQPLQAYSAAGKIKKLLEQGVDTLICGGIDRLSRQQIGFNRIEVYSWVTGEIEDAVSCFLRNGLNSGTILGSNGKKEGRWQFRQRGFLRNVLQKSAHRGSAEASMLPESNPDEMGRGKRGAGQGRGKGKGSSGGGSGPGQGGRRGKNPGDSGTSGRNKNRRGTGKNLK